MSQKGQPTHLKSGIGLLESFHLPRITSNRCCLWYHCQLLVIGCLISTCAGLTACDKSVNEAPAEFEREVYIPHLTIMPDTVLPNDTFRLKASVFLENGCQLFDSLGINRQNRTISLTYQKKELQNKDFSCNPRETFILEKRIFSFKQQGDYTFAFKNGNGNTVKTQTVTVAADTPAQNFEWQLRLANTDVPRSTLDQLLVAHKEDIGPTVPDAPGVDTIYREAMNRVNDTFYQYKVRTVEADSVIFDSLRYSFKVGRGSAMRDTFSVLTNDNVIYRGQPEVIRKGPSPLNP